MRLGELIEVLQDMVEDGQSEGSEVRIMSQQSWPFENSLHGVVPGAQVYDGSEEDEDECDPEGVEECADGKPADEVVFIVEGRQIGYGSKNAWNR